MKKKWVIISILLIILLLVAYILIRNQGSKEKAFSFDAGNIISIEFLNGGDGETNIIGDKEDIEYIISFLNEYTYTSEKDYIPFDGYVYRMTIYEKTNENPTSIYLWENSISVDPSGKEYTNAEPDYFNNFIADWFPDYSTPPWS